MQVTAVQLPASPNVDANVDRAVERVRGAAAAGTDLVVLPELWHVGYFDFAAYETAAQPADGRIATRFSRLAAELEIHLHAGSFVERDGSELYNTSLLFGPDGDRLGTYRKLHLFGYGSEEANLLTPGESVVAVDTDLGTVGLTTCYDLRFPELYRALVEKGVDALLVTAAWPTARADHWHLLVRTRALECQTPLVAANLTGSIGDVDLAGQSVVVDAWGTERANAGNGPRTLHANLDRGETADVRETFPVLRDRRIGLQYRIGESRRAAGSSPD